jgi:hypothetical protein
LFAVARRQHVASKVARAVRALERPVTGRRHFLARGALVARTGPTKSGGSPWLPHGGSPGPTHAGRPLVSTPAVRTCVGAATLREQLRPTQTL